MRTSKSFKLIATALAIALAVTLVVPTAFVEAAGVKLNTKTVSICKGKSYTLKMSGVSKKVKWTTSNKDVVSVKKSGKLAKNCVVTGKKGGSATVTAKVKVGKKTKSYKCKVYVVDISKTKKTINVGKSYTVKMRGVTKKVNWTTSNKSVASVKASGKYKQNCVVTAKSDGTATITAKVKVGKKTKSFKFAVTVPKQESEVPTDTNVPPISTDIPNDTNIPTTSTDDVNPADMDFPTKCDRCGMMVKSVVLHYRTECPYDIDYYGNLVLKTDRYVVDVGTWDCKKYSDGTYEVTDKGREANRQAYESEKMIKGDDWVNYPRLASLDAYVISCAGI